jgi:thiosulfate dehydrogenase
MKKFLIGVVLGILLVPAVIFLYFLFGFAPVATSDPMFPFEKFFASTALHARLNKEMPKSVSLPADEATFQAGAEVYMHNCAVCHGSINRPESAVAKGMFPPPPQLLDPDHMVTDDPPGEIFWKVRNGIRLTGMPGFHASLADDQMWQVSLMLANADKLPDSVRQALTFNPPAGQAAPNAAKPADGPTKK